ncbi:MAG: ATP-binding protein [Lachnospiraceae bacterium]|nr:ATP-binding protein [Lachnospiraceae bacterium]
MKKRLISMALTIAIVVGIGVMGILYFRFISGIIYSESTAHLKEIYHQANQTLYNLVSVNWSRMRLWTPYLGTAESEEAIADFVNRAREETHFTNFYFISRDGKYLSLEGERGYLDLREKLFTLILEKQSVVVNSVVPDRPEIMVFAVPAAPGSYRGFHYEAIAISFNNTDLVEALKISAFNGHSSTYAVLPDGRVVVDNASENMGKIHNFFAALEKSGGLTQAELTRLQQDFLEGNSGTLVINLDNTSYYLVYEPAGFQNWMVLGIVPTGVVNSSMNALQTTTILLVAGISIMLGMFVLVFVIQQNRMKLKRKDKELLARDELFSKLSVNVDDVFLMVDAKKLRVEYVSPNIGKLVGISEQQVLKDIYVLERLIRTDEPIHLLEQFSEISPGEQHEWDREYIHQKTGEKRWFRVAVFCSDIQGEKKYILDLSDRTKERKNNKKLAEAVKTAENANRAKTTFLNNMSHDIRTPMNAIIGFTNIAMKQEARPEVRDCLKKICDSSEHLLTLINDVLDISRIESGKTRLNPVPVDINAVADAVIDIMYGFLSNRMITFDIKRENPENPYVLADAVRIREVLVNILANAVKFTDDGGKITFEITYHPGEDEKHRVVRYCVTDTGVGMSEEFVKHIFEEFSQEESSARTQYKGTGLGMAITKRYVELMNGTISVKSKKGEGSAFVVEFPVELTDESNVQTQDTTIAGVNMKGIRVLLAEDNDLNAEIAMVQLEELGMTVTRVSDGKEAVKLFCNSVPNTFDVILMDIMMPEMNGYEATRVIRSLQGHPEAHTIPIIALTANAFAEDVQESLDVGMNGHLSKPIVMEEVVKMIARNLNR